MTEAEPPSPAAGPEEEGQVGAPIMAGVARQTVLLSATTAIGQVFTFLRELFIASQVGTSLGLDALLVAAVIPQAMASLLASGAGAAVIPGYLEAERREGRPAADRLMGALLTWTVIIGLFIIAFVLAVPQLILFVSGPGLPEASRDNAAGYLPILAPIIVLSALTGLLSAIFQIRGWLTGIALAWAVGPFASLVAVIALWPPLGLTAVAVAMTLQQAVAVVVLILLALRRGWLPAPTLHAPRNDLVSFGRHAGPLTLSASVLQLNLLTDRAVASLFGPGSVSALRFAEGIIRLPMNVIGPGWSAAIYPALVRASHEGDDQSLGDAAGDALRYVTALFVPLSVATMALAPLIVAVVYLRGAFTEQDAMLTSLALVGFGPLLYLNMANSILTGAHNARRRGWFLMWMGISNAILNAVFNVAFGVVIGVAGVALSTSVTMGIIQGIKAQRLAGVDRSFPIRAMWVTLGRATVASVAAAIPVGIVAWLVPLDIGTLPMLALLTVLTAVGTLLYIVVSRLIGLREPIEIVQVMIASRPPRLRRA